MSDNSTKISLEQFKHVNFDAMNIPEGEIHWSNPYDLPQWSFEEKSKISALAPLTLSEWKRRLARGKFVNIDEIGYDNIIDSLHEIRQSHPWRLVRVANVIETRKIVCPIVYKTKTGYHFIDGRTTAMMFNHFKKPFKVWVIDDTVDSDDYTRALDPTVQAKIDQEEEKQGGYTKVFDYSTIDDSHKALIRDVVERLEKENQHSLAQELKITCKLEDNDKYDIEKSPFFKIAKKYPLSINRQGFVTQSANGKITEYPIISTCADIRIYNKMIEEIIETYVINKQ